MNQEIVEYFKSLSADELRNIISSAANELANRCKSTIQKEPSNGTCLNCGKSLAIRQGKNGKFLGCTGYPQCKYTEKLVEDDCPF